MNFLFARILIASMLILALQHLPYGYYEFLRIAVCAVTGYGAFRAIEVKKPFVAWIFGSISILFNPVIPIYLKRATWHVLDLITAGVILTTLFLFNERRGNEQIVSSKGE